MKLFKSVNKTFKSFLRMARTIAGDQELLSPYIIFPLNQTDWGYIQLAENPSPDEQQEEKNLIGLTLNYFESDWHLFVLPLDIGPKDEEFQALGVENYYRERNEDVVKYEGGLFTFDRDKEKFLTGFEQMATTLKNGLLSDYFLTRERMPTAKETELIQDFLNERSKTIRISALSLVGQDL